MKSISFIESLNRAIEGFFHILTSQRNMRIHFIIALLAIILGIILNFNYLELAILISIIVLVLFAEMANTLIEYLLDLYKPDPDPLVKLVKDISAGSVLLVSFFSIGVGYLLFSKRMNIPFDSFLTTIKQSDWHISLVILFLLIFVVILVKYILRKGSPLRGGFPSGHTAFAFSVWTLVCLLQNNKVVDILVFILAMLIARSRVRMKVHNLYETIMGALLGVVFTLLIYQLLSTL